MHPRGGRNPPACGTERRLVLSQAMHRLSPGLPPESTVTIVRLPSDEPAASSAARAATSAFEHASGVDILIDETPGVIMLSSHNPLRREIAQRALKLVEDGRIHPGRIEETVQETRDAAD